MEQEGIEQEVEMQESNPKSHMEEFDSSPIISEKRIWNMNNVFISLFIGIFLIILFTIILFVTMIDTLYKVILAAFLVVLYAIVLFFLLEPKILREIRHTQLRTSEPIIKEVIVEKPVQIIHEIEKPIYYTNPRKTLSIPKYDYVGSSETKTFHLRNCRLGKLIKKKYKLVSNEKTFFTKNKYKPCQVCILKTKRV